MRCTRSTSAQGRTVPIAFSSVTEAVCTEFRLAPLENENQTDRQSPFSSVVSADASKVPAVRSSLSDSASIVPDSGSRSSAASDPRWAMVVVTSDVITITDRRLITVRNVDLLLRAEWSSRYNSGSAVKSMSVRSSFATTTRLDSTKLNLRLATVITYASPAETPSKLK